MNIVNWPWITSKVTMTTSTVGYPSYSWVSCSPVAFQ